MSQIILNEPLSACCGAKITSLELCSECSEPAADRPVYVEIGAKKPRDLTADVFGSLTVLGWAGFLSADGKPPRRSSWRCLCECGKDVVAVGSELIRGKKISCGCKASRLTIGNRSVKHGASRAARKSVEYRAYTHAKNRCCNPNNNNFENYGGRGIEFRFTSFEQFFAEVGPRPTPSHSLDRIENEGHYEAGNVHWGTKEEQALNRRDALLLTFNGRTQNASLWAKELNIPYQRIPDRKARGWCDSCTLTLPLVVGGISGRSSCEHIDPIKTDEQGMIVGSYALRSFPPARESAKHVAGAIAGVVGLVVFYGIASVVEAVMGTK